ncbi:hypothetical protein REA19_01040 [Prescottella equi]|nr:hypothetical protein REA19_01040 [Prescottella equi]
MKIGWIGLGNMGLPMAANLHSAGFELVGFDLSSAARDDAAAPPPIRPSTSQRTPTS